MFMNIHNIAMEKDSPYHSSKVMGEDAYKAMKEVGIAVIEIIASYEPTVIDYMRGRVDVNIQETYVDSVLVKRDTIITYKK